jgi:hypothetical protein
MAEQLKHRENRKKEQKELLLSGELAHYLESIDLEFAFVFALRKLTLMRQSLFPDQALAH